MKLFVAKIAEIGSVFRSGRTNTGDYMKFVLSTLFFLWVQVGTINVLAQLNPSI